MSDELAQQRLASLQAEIAAQHQQQLQQALSAMASNVLPDMAAMSATMPTSDPAQASLQANFLLSGLGQTDMSAASASASAAQVALPPPVAESAAAGAAQDSAEKPSIEGRMYGVVKSYNPEKGFGFIACAHTYQMFQRDVFLLHKEKERCRAQVGSMVSFNVELNKDGHPQARNLEVVSTDQGFFGHLTPEMEAFAMQAQLACAQVIQAHIEEQQAAKVVPAAFRQARLDSGVVGPIGPANPEAVARGRQLSGRLPMPAAQSQSSTPGMEAPVSLPILDQSAAPELPGMSAAMMMGGQDPTTAAAAAMMMGGAADPMQGADMSGFLPPALAQFCEGGKYAHYAAALQLQYAALAQGAEQVEQPTTGSAIAPERQLSPGEYLGHDPSRRFTGNVHQWNDEGGYGFILCPDARKIYAKDIFLHRSEIGREADIYKNKRMTDACDGDKVEFNVEIISGKPRARDVDIIQKAERPHPSTYNPESDQASKRRRT
mmetsp:Transcript_127955/g.220675  ORF Transcript_127955/g.220675 Transcript_127955/m.220675 type:complete len:490 (+) Transcript_127955:126-1595(+)